jgi:hypothetical protein
MGLVFGHKVGSRIVFFQLYDVTKLMIIHKKIQPNFAIDQI